MARPTDRTGAPVNSSDAANGARALGRGTVHWFRSYHGAPTDPKWLAVLARATAALQSVTNSSNAESVTRLRVADVVALWWVLLDHASQRKERGSLDGFDAESAAMFLGLTVDEVAAILDAMRQKNLITGDRIRTWEDRNPKREDDSAPRVRAFRARAAAKKPPPPSVTTPVTQDVTQRNARVEKSRDELQLQQHPSAPVGANGTTDVTPKKPSARAP